MDDSASQNMADFKRLLAESSPETNSRIAKLLRRFDQLQAENPDLTLDEYLRRLEWRPTPPLKLQTPQIVLYSL